MALTSFGRVLAWGDDTGHQCSVPVLPKGELFVRVGAARFMSWGFTSEGRLLAWGRSAQMRSWRIKASDSVTSNLSEGEYFVDIAANMFTFLISTSRGRILSWINTDYEFRDVPKLPPEERWSVQKLAPRTLLILSLEADEVIFRFALSGVEVPGSRCLDKKTLGSLQLGLAKLLGQAFSTITIIDSSGRAVSV